MRYVQYGIMPGHKKDYFLCILCSKRTKPSDRRKINQNIRKYLRRKFLIEAPSENSVICNRCRHVYRTETQGTKRSDVCTHVPCTSVLSSEDQNKQKRSMSSPPSVSLPLASTAKSHAYCCVCKKPGPKLVVVAAESRTAVFVEKNILIPPGNRCCPAHLHDGMFTSDAVKQLQTTENSFVNRTTITDLLQQMRLLCQRNEKQCLDFDDAKALTDTDYKSLLGITKANFRELCDSVEGLIKNTPARSLTTSVAIFFCKMKTGLSNVILSTLFRTSKSSLRRAISAVRKALLIKFVPENLGFTHISREEIINKHTRPLAQTLFGSIEKNQVILVLDGTYIYVNKSNNFHFQRRSYSIHKGRPLIKPMVVVTTTGYFVSILGPYLADRSNNDASILSHIINSNAESIRSWLNEDDVFVVDRGFRDALPLLADLGIQAEMPTFLKAGQKQMSTEDANMSRLVTKVRWVVESSNARIKRWRYLDRVLPTNQIPNIGDYVRIVCAVSNKFSPPLSSYTSKDEDDAEAAKMLHLSKQVNHLKTFVDENGLQRKTAVWKSASEVDLDSFPRLDDEELRNLTCGTYQLKLSSSYMQEHLDGESDIYFHEEDNTLLRAKIQSRHISSKKYQLWIHYSESTVESWYCTCRAGARVVGMCSHIAAVIWYLSSARYGSDKSLGVRDWCKHVLDAADIPASVDESDSDSGESLPEE